MSNLHKPEKKKMEDHCEKEKQLFSQPRKWALKVLNEKID